MTDKSKPETLTDADLDGVQGGAGNPEKPRTGAKLPRGRAEPYIGETEKNIVAQGGTGNI